MTAYILNLLDLAFTLHVLDNGGVELNPVIRWMMEVHPALFPLPKTVLAGLLCWWLERKSQTIPAARKGLIAITAYYGAVVLWHIVNIAPSIWAVLFR